MSAGFAVDDGGDGGGDEMNTDSVDFYRFGCSRSEVLIAASCHQRNTHNHQ